ncbi:subclass B3 metallo-beta-lactamase [Mucilaginibacter sp.]
MLSFKKLMQAAFVAASLLFTGVIANAQVYIKPPIMQANWSYPYEPFRIVGNLYYVGTYDLACYLITTPKGHILINTGLADATPMIIQHIESLGFKVKDIKILLATHGHYDHVAGMAELKKLTGAKILINKRDAAVLADGGNSDYVFGGKGMTFPPVKPDGLLDNNDVVKLGDMKITCIPTPGHTPGATSFLFDVKDEKRTYKVLIANMPTVLDDANLVTGMPLYPDVAKDYATTFETMRKLQFDIFLASHAAQFNMHQKHKPGDAYNPDVFIDRKGYDAALDNFYRLYQRKLKQ